MLLVTVPPRTRVDQVFFGSAFMAPHDFAISASGVPLSPVAKATGSFSFAFALGTSLGHAEYLVILSVSYFSKVTAAVPVV